MNDDVLVMRRPTPEGGMHLRKPWSRRCARLPSCVQLWNEWRRAEDGVAALEFALIAPILFFGLVASVDVGMAEYERMTIDHALRAGAQSAMVDPGTTAVMQVVRTTASKNFTLAPESASPHALTVSATRFCACPDSTAVAVACSTTCPGPTAHTFIYYRLTGSKVYEAMILPAMTLSASAQVQVR